MKTLIALSTAILLNGCPPSPTAPDGGTPPPPPPVADAAPPQATDASAPAPSGPFAQACAAACSNVLSSVPSCPEGHYADCAYTCTVVQGDPKQVHPNLTSLAAAKTAAAVKAAGWTCAGGK